MSTFTDVSEKITQEIRKNMEGFVGEKTPANLKKSMREIFQSVWIARASNLKEVFERTLEKDRQIEGGEKL